MPEGDTIWRAARNLHHMLAGKVVQAATATAPGVDAAGLIGRTLVEVTAQGKNLLMRFDDDRVLHTHMRMNGSWHIYPPTTRWRKPMARARIVLEVDDAVAVCFNAPVVALLRSGHPASVMALGPDILAETFDLAEALRRFRTAGPRELGDAVLDQRLVAGIGNVYKSETLFARRANPFATLETVTDETLGGILTAARGFMRDNLTGSKRRIRLAGEGGHIWVYRRKGEPCLRCGTPIEMRRQGSGLRSTYFCPSCQSAPL